MFFFKYSTSFCNSHTNFYRSKCWFIIFRYLIPSPQHQIRRCWGELGLHISASHRAVLVAYRQRALLTHPDKVIRGPLMVWMVRWMELVWWCLLGRRWTYRTWKRWFGSDDLFSGFLFFSRLALPGMCWLVRREHFRAGGLRIFKILHAPFPLGFESKHILGGEYIRYAAARFFEIEPMFWGWTRDVVCGCGCGCCWWCWWSCPSSIGILEPSTKAKLNKTWVIMRCLFFLEQISSAEVTPNDSLGSGFECFLFSPLPGDMIQLD